MKISIKLLDTSKKIERNFNAIASQAINKRMNKNVARVKKSLRQLVYNWIITQPEIISLGESGVQNSLASMFGLTSIEGNFAAAAIAGSIADSIIIDFNKIKKNLDGAISFNFQSESFSNLLSLSIGTRTTEKGDVLPWLDWLLTKGDTVVVIGYFYNPSNQGRSGGGTMKEGGFFRVPPQFSGTAQNNLITRAFEGREKQIATILMELLK